MFILYVEWGRFYRKNNVRKSMSFSFLLKDTDQYNLVQKMFFSGLSVSDGNKNNITEV